MHEQLLVGLTAIIVLGVSSQWLASQLRVPSILLLLLVGFIAGPVTGFIDPDALLGELLFPLVSLSVAIILFEGSLSLRYTELREVGRVVLKLVSLGVLVTWLIATVAANFVLGLGWSLAVLLGAVLVVTGPTVIIPLLQLVRPKGQVGSTLKWEGILIDPVGAVLAVLVFDQAILAGEFRNAPLLIAQGMLVTAFVGTIIGLLGTGFMVFLLRRYWIPDQLQNGVSLLVVVSAFTVSQLLVAESGLLAVVVMGIALTNQRFVPVRHIVEFKENLRTLLLGILFILLAGRLRLSEITQLSYEAFIYLAILIIVARPASVFVSTWGSRLSRQEKIFLASVAPRGVVAAAVSSVFALRLVEAGFTEAERLVPLTFMVIVGTVLIYGLAALPLGRWLGVSEANPQGVLIVGADLLGRSIARSLTEQDFRVLLIDSNWHNISEARMAGLETHYGNALAEYTLEEIDLTGIGRLLALTSNDEANSLAALHFAEVFRRSEVYQLPITKDQDVAGHHVSPQHLRGRILFGPNATQPYLRQQLEAGATVKATQLTTEFNYEDFRQLYDEEALPLFLVTETRQLLIYTTENRPIPKPGQTLISLIRQAETAKQDEAEMAVEPG